jgi:hypothetical protein
MQFDHGLVEPTWEPKARMLEQMPDNDKYQNVCWYGRTDGKVEARIAISEWQSKSHLFERQGDDWILVNSYEEITVQ